MTHIRPGRHLTRAGIEVYIACRCTFDGGGRRKEYPWWVDDSRGGYSVDEFGRAMKNATTIFDIVSIVDELPAPPTTD